MVLNRKEQKRILPKILALETATMCGSVAVMADEICVAEYSLVSQQTHSRRLLSGIDRLLVDAEISWRDIDAIAVSLGPGSFTGLRIGLSTAKGLAFATGKPLIGVGTLDGLAAQFFKAAGLICPVLDARKKEVYAALYRASESGVCERQSDYLVLSPENLCRRIDEPVLFVGDGALLYKEKFTDQLGGRALFAPGGCCYPRAAAIGMLAVSMWKEQEFLDPAEVVPLYVRPSEAELLFAKG